MLPGEAQLDFEMTNADGKFSAPEASLKSLVFINATSNHVATATGAKRCGAACRVHGVSGMAGSGKTMALIGLGHDEDIRTHFVDGVLYISIEATATVEHVTGQLNKIMRVTGATESASNILSATSLADAVTKAAIWFQGKRILFLIDDIWPTSACPAGYLTEVEGLLLANPESRIVVSTRSPLISAHGGSRVDFDARDPRGPISAAIFIAHAVLDMSPSESNLEASRGILDLCSGLPIALSVPRSTVSMYMKMGLKFESACVMCLDEISNEMEQYPAASFLDSAIRLSISVLEADFEKHLDYCRKNLTRVGTEQVWHRRLLDGHMTLDESLNESRANEDVCGQLGVNILEYTPRPWWRGDVKNNEYIRKHLSRHLHSAGLHLELGATMMDFRWILSQADFGGVLRLT